MDNRRDVQDVDPLREHWEQTLQKQEDKSKEPNMRLFETAFINPDKEDIKDTKDNDSFSDNIEAIPYTVIQEYKVIFRFTGILYLNIKITIRVMRRDLIQLLPLSVTIQVCFLSLTFPCS